MVACTRCSTENVEGAKFCAECGGPLARACPACGHPTTGGKFCIECGAPLAGAPAPAPAPAPGGVPVSERRTTTVLFGDLVGFTTLSESRDPEEVRELLSAYFSVARTVVGRYGGTIEKFIGDAVMAVWGVPTSHEDDAERAVRAGLDLVAEVAELGASVGAPGLAMRAGIVTGSVAVTLGATQEGMVAGDAVNTASRVQGAADPGTVWVDQQTYGLTAAAVAFSDMGEHELKGKTEPVRLFRADSVVAAVGGAQRVDGLEAPLAGRERELRAVKELLHATQSDGRARLAVVTGVAGVGKSRLGWEFEKYTDGLNDLVYWHRGRCLSYGDGVAFWAFAEMVRSRLDIVDTDGPEDLAEKVRTGVAAVCASPAEAAWLTPRVAALLGSGDRAEFDRTDLFASWTTFLERVGGEDPIVLLFEDTQHADSGLLDLVEHLLETSRARLYILLLARPELLEARPSLMAGRRTSVVDLAPLDEAAMSMLLDGLVDDLPARARAALTARADGIPLYAVETVRSLIDRDAVVARGGRYVFVDHDHALVDLDQLAAPTSLQTLIAARLDKLSPVERRVVQDASVLGLTFRPAALSRLSGLRADEVEAALAALVRKGLLEPQTDPRSPDRGSYRFLQALVREVAHSTLSRRDRRARHLAAALHLEEENSDAVAGIVAQHLRDALEASPPEDPERPSMLLRARNLHRVASDRAAGLGSQEEALHGYLTALELGPDPAEEAELWADAAAVATAAGQSTLAEDLATRAVDRWLELDRPADAAAALSTLGRTQVGLGRVSEAGPTVQRGLDLLDRAGDRSASVARIRLNFLGGTVARARGDRDAQARFALQAASLAEERRDPTLLVLTLNGIGVTMADGGVPTAYLAILDRAVRIAREERLLGELGRTLINLSSVLYPEDLARGTEFAVEAIEVCRQAGEVYNLSMALTNAAFAWFLAGEWDQLAAAMTEHREGVAAVPADGVPWLMLTQVQRARGEALPGWDVPTSEDPYDRLVTGLHDAVVQAVDGAPVAAAARAAAVVREVVGEGSMREDFEMLWAPAVELQLEAGDAVTATELLELADAPGRASALFAGVVPRLRGLVALARGEDPEPHLREAATALEEYGASYLLARTRLELGSWLHGRGRVPEAVSLLARSRETFVALRAAPSIAEVDALIDLVAAPVAVAAER